MLQRVAFHHRWLLLVVVLLLALAALPAAAPIAQAQTAPYVELRGWAVLPADTFAAGPPAGFAIGPANGRQPPFARQPVQGFSSVLPLWNGNWLGLSDNGFGAKGNSPDYRLRWYEIKADFNRGSVGVVGYTEMSDPKRLVPFPIVNGNGDRVLTGADFDPESFRQAPDGTFWVGDEFGPFLLHLDAQGRLLEPPYPTPVPPALRPFARGLAVVKSPEHPDFVALPTPEARRAAANLPTSRGFEGMALNASGTRLYPLLEGPLFDDPVRNRLLLREFDLATRQYTDRIWFYPMEAPNHAIGDLTAINDREFLVIERDGGEGPTALFKRIYLVSLDRVSEGSLLQKELVVDLMQIADPNKLTRAEEGAFGFGSIFKFPFVTIEAVYPVDSRTLLVLNDNNYPFSAGRRPGLAPDDNEFILVYLPKSLNLKRG
ncbi:MAG: esterase-like activity of phytase family protein [Chloroflexi bacterium]|nr:esterase-like activity of phytase family protein [Chloroflexota bacterium]